MATKTATKAPKITLASLAKRIASLEAYEDKSVAWSNEMYLKVNKLKDLHTELQNDFSKHHKDFVALQKDHTELDEVFADIIKRGVIRPKRGVPAGGTPAPLTPLQEFANRLCKLTRRQTEWFQDRVIDQNVALAYADWHRFGRNVRQGETSIGSLLFLRSQTFLKNVHVAHDYLYQQIAGYYQQWGKIPPEVCAWLAEAATTPEH